MISSDESPLRGISMEIDCRREEEGEKNNEERKENELISINMTYSTGIFDSRSRSVNGNYSCENCWAEQYGYCRLRNTQWTDRLSKCLLKALLHSFAFFSISYPDALFEDEVCQRRNARKESFTCLSSHSNCQAVYKFTDRWLMCGFFPQHDAE